ncbi:unnamed protein product [Peronospora farinosa]|uniref:Uncharacterized protein n=1 Tax=Peronospora farinosa TaxID=134698 RepID=A0AAV0T6R2_9STRA|nr:unnamed protein product [Peronospora farinosa]
MHEYQIREERNMDAFEWLFAKLGDLRNRKALPNFPANEQRVMNARRVTRYLLYNTDQYNTLIKSLRLEMEKAQIRTKVNGLHDRQKKQKQRRLPVRRSRGSVKPLRTSIISKLPSVSRLSKLAKNEREKERYEKQLSTTLILFFDVVRDQSVRNSEASIANDFIVHSYGIFQDQKNKLPRELVNLHADFVKIQEPELLEEEGDIVDDEWMKLAMECEHWTSNRANMKREDKLCCDDDARYKQEHEYVRLEAEARQKNANAVKADCWHSRRKLMPVHAQSLSGARATRLLIKHMRRSGVLCKMSASTPPRRFGMNTWPVLRGHEAHGCLQISSLAKSSRSHAAI